jgi:O-antigen/teichoic acid export membrane protein
MTFGLSGMIAQIISFFLLPIYTRYLSPTDYGVIAMLFLITASFQTIAGLGINEAIFKFFRDPEINKVQLQSTGFITILFSAFIVFIIGFLFQGVLNEKLLEPTTRNGSTLILFSLIYSFFISLSSVFNTIIRAERKVKSAFVVSMTFLITQISISFILIIYFNAGVLGLITGQMIAQIFVFFTLIYLTRSTFYFKLNFQLFKKMLSYGIFSVPAQVLETLMGQLGQYMIKSSLSLKQSGLYGIADRITLPIQIIGNSMRYAHSAFFFQILNEEKDPKPILRAMASFYVALLTYLWVGVSIFGVEILRFLTPPAFHVASELIGPIALIPVLLIIYTFISSGIDSGNNLKPYIIVNAMGFIFYFLSLYILLEKVGLIGAAYSSIITRIVMIIVSNYFSQKRLKVPYNIISIIILISLGIFSIIINNIFYTQIFKIRIIVILIISIVFPIIAIISLMIFPIERKQVFNFINIKSNK